MTMQEVVDLFVTNQDTLAILKTKVTVVYGFDKPYGKFADTFGNIVVLDS
jgi:hypothetical protein